MDLNIQIADRQHIIFSKDVCKLIEESAKIRGTGIAKRKPEYIEQKMESGNAIIAWVNEKLAGFCYIETWEHGRYIAHSGLIVAPEFRKMGLAKKIKSKAFELAQTKYPNSKVFGITTSLAVMKINSELGYKPVTFSELTQEDTFWSGCQSCPNYDILQRNQRKICLCTGMLYQKEDQPENLQSSNLLKFSTSTSKS